MMVKNGVNSKHTLCSLGLLGGLSLGLGTIGIDPRITEAIKAHATMLVLTDLADGKSPGVNSPFTNPLMDLANGIGRNLFDLNYVNTVTKSGVSVSDNSILLDDTYATLLGKNIFNNLVPGKTYKIKAERVGVNDSYNPIFYFQSGQSNVLILQSRQTEGTFTVPLDVENWETLMYGKLGTVIGLKNIIVTETEDSTDPYEPFNRNDVSLTQFAETTASGYDVVTVPNGTITMLNKDGIDDRPTIANNANLDPTGTQDFAICGILKNKVALDGGWIFCKNLDTNLSTVQFGLFVISSDGGGRLRLGNGLNLIIPPGTFIADKIQSYVIKKIGSNIKLEIDGNTIINQVFTATLTSQPNFNLGCRSASIDNTTFAEFTNVYDGAFAFYYNGNDGLVEADVDASCALIAAPYF